MATEGAPIRHSAREANRQKEASDAYHARKRLGEPDPPQTPPLSTDVIKVRNATGTALRQGEIVELNGHALTVLDKLHPCFVAAVPDGTRPFAVMLEPLPNNANAIGHAQIDGRCPALVNFTATTDKWAKVSNGLDVLQSSEAAGSVRVLHAPAATGEQLVWVKFETASLSIVQFRLTANLPANNTSGVAAVIRTFNGTAYVDGAAIKVFDWYAISQAGRGMFQGITGMEGEALKREKKADTTPGAPDEYDIIWMEQYAGAIEFTLLGNLSSGSASATVTASWEQGVAPASPVTVHDDQGRWPDAITGCKGTALRSEYADPANPTVPYYKVVSCTRAVIQAEAEIISPMCGDAPAISVLQSIAAGEHVQAVAAAGQTFTNPHSHYGRSGDTVWLVRESNTPPFTWSVRDVTKHVIQVTTGIQRAANCTISRNYWPEVAVEMCTTVEQTETILTFAPVAVMTNAYEGSDALYGQTLVVYAPCTGAGSIFTIAQTTDCVEQPPTGYSQPTGQEELMLLADNQAAQEQSPDTF